jgi:hypothetical protein
MTRGMEVIMKPYRPKLHKCPFCKEKIAYAFIDGKKITVEQNINPALRWNEHSCFIDLSEVEE